MRLIYEGPTRISMDTVKAADSRRAPDQRIVIRDSSCRGLALVINAKGRAWRYDYRPRGLDPPPASVGQTAPSSSRAPRTGISRSQALNWPAARPHALKAWSRRAAIRPRNAALR